MSIPDVLSPVARRAYALSDVARDTNLPERAPQPLPRIILSRDLHSSCRDLQY